MPAANPGLEQRLQGQRERLQAEITEAEGCVREEIKRVQQATIFLENARAMLKDRQERLQKFEEAMVSRA